MRFGEILLFCVEEIVRNNFNNFIVFIIVIVEKMFIRLFYFFYEDFWEEFVY